MSASLRRFSPTLAAVALAIAALIASRHTPRAVAAQADAEVARIRAHLERVEYELLSADVSAFSAEQRAARTYFIAVLREYREAGVFPHNHTAGERTPVFVDEHGTHCAVGYLIARSGRKDIVEHVRSTRNNATVHQLADEPAFLAWLNEAGLTLAEAARIQPEYRPRPPQDAQGSSRGYKTASVLGAGLGGGVIAWNLLTDAGELRTLPGAVALGVGLGEIALAGLGLELDGRDGREIHAGYMALNAGMGAAAALIGARRLLRGSPAAAAREEPVRQSLRWSVSPWRPTAEPGGAAGLRLDLVF